MKQRQTDEHSVLLVVVKTVAVFFVSLVSRLLEILESRSSHAKEPRGYVFENSLYLGILLALGKASAGQSEVVNHDGRFKIRVQADVTSAAALVLLYAYRRH